MFLQDLVPRRDGDGGDEAREEIQKVVLEDLVGRAVEVDDRARELVVGFEIFL